MEKSRTLFYGPSSARLTKGNMLLQIMVAEWELKYKRPATWYATEWTLYRIYQDAACGADLDPRLDIISRELETYAENKGKPNIEASIVFDMSAATVEPKEALPKPKPTPLPPTLAFLGWNLFFEPVFKHSEIVFVHFYLIDSRRNLSRASFISITKLICRWFMHTTITSAWDFTVFTYNDTYAASYRKKLKLGDERLSTEYEFRNYERVFKGFKGLSFVSLNVGQYFNHTKKTSAVDTPEAQAERVQKALAILDAPKPKKKPPRRKPAKPKQLTMKQLMSQRLAKLKEEKAANEVFDLGSK
ncbi:MAG: hypothetical protein AB9921_02520 [Erysipelotrichaceae bacterium]